MSSRMLRKHPRRVAGFGTEKSEIQVVQIAKYWLISVSTLGNTDPLYVIDVSLLATEVFPGVCP
jgi:hypothetical protein